MAELLVALGAPFHQLHDFWDLVVYCCDLVGLPLYAFTGQYKGLTLCGSVALYRLSVRNGLLVFCWQLPDSCFGCRCHPQQLVLLWLLLLASLGLCALLFEMFT